MTTKTPFCPALPRNKVPNDGPGPRGFPDCYYISRTLNSTFRYARFVKKLRIAEEEQRKGLENNIKALKDQQISDFFIRCDRRSLINNVARRVDLCMRSYENDLEDKKQRLKTLFAEEETANIRKVVMQAQAAAGTIWQEKMDRLQYLLQKRKKEHEEKYKDTPISKCVHVRPCITKLLNKETQEMQLYQMHEKHSMKMQEKELDKMWYEVGMKESEALAARMEIDAIERYHRDMDCKQHSDMILAQREKQREIDRELLKKEQLAMNAQFEADIKKEKDEEAARREKHLKMIRECMQSVEEAHAMQAKQEEADNVIRETWSSLAGQGMAEEEAKGELLRKRKKDLDAANIKLLELKAELANSYNEGGLTETARAQQDVIDRKRCDYLLWSQKTNREGRKAMMEQIEDRVKAREEMKSKIAKEEEYRKQLQRQLDQLMQNKAVEDAMERKRNQQDLVKQIQYNQLVKERALQEELEQRQKAAIVAREYQESINAMLCRPSFSDDVNPFMKQMLNIKMKGKCPCSNPDWCKD